MAALLRRRLAGRPWAEVRRLCESGKVFVDGEAARDPAARLGAGAAVELRMRAPRPVAPLVEALRIVHEDDHLVVIDKPSGVSSVPYERRETGTAMDLLRSAWRRMGRRATATVLRVVHRIDKETSGLLLYAKTPSAERLLAAQFRAHTVERTYLAVAHGAPREGRIESSLVPDRGDRLRGTSRTPGQGRRAVTHVAVLERLSAATLCEVRLETGKTHQIRIHLAEAGCPLVGERVYIRDYERRGGVPLPASRLLLHAATLGFEQPTGGRLAFESPPPADFQRALAALRGRARRR